MLSAVLAQAMRGWQGWGVVEFAIAIVVFLAICGLVLIFCRVTGLNPPQWLWQVVGIVVAAIIIIAAIRFVAGM